MLPEEILKFNKAIKNNPTLSESSKKNYISKIKIINSCSDILFFEINQLLRGGQQHASAAPELRALVDVKHVHAAVLSSHDGH